MLLILTQYKCGSCGPLIYIKNYIKINSKEFQTLTIRSNTHRSEDKSQYLIIEDCHNVTCTMSTIKKIVSLTFAILAMFKLSFNIR